MQDREEATFGPSHPSQYSDVAQVVQTIWPKVQAHIGLHFLKDNVQPLISNVEGTVRFMFASERLRHQMQLPLLALKHLMAPHLHEVQSHQCQTRQHEFLIFIFDAFLSLILPIS